jgi:hypothetical protein
MAMFGGAPNAPPRGDTANSGLVSYINLSHHAKNVIEMKWSTDGVYLGTASFDKSVKIAQVESNGSTRVVQTGSWRLSYLSESSFHHVCIMF